MYYNPISPQNLYQNTYHFVFLQFGMYFELDFKENQRINTYLFFLIQTLVCIYRRFIPKITTVLHTKLYFFNLVCTYSISLTKTPLTYIPNCIFTFWYVFYTLFQQKMVNFGKKIKKSFGNIPKFSLFFLLYIWRYL